MRKVERWEKRIKGEVYWNCPMCHSSDISFQAMSGTDRILNNLYFCRSCGFKEMKVEEGLRTLTGPDEKGVFLQDWPEGRKVKWKRYV